MKKHPRMLKLATKLLAGHSLEFVDRFATDFADYRRGVSNLHPALLDCFKRFESVFAIAFKHRHLIELNHNRRTGIYGNVLLEMIRNLESENGSPKKYYQDYYYQQPKMDQDWYFTEPSSNGRTTLH